MLKRFSIYNISVFIPILLSFFLFPIFTNYLTPGEYGIRAIILMAVLLFNVFSDYGTNWVIRYRYFRFNSKDEKSVYLTSMLIVSLILKLFFSLLLFSLKDLIFPLFFSAWTDYYSDLLNIQILIFLLTFINNTVYPVLILEKQDMKYTSLLLGSFFINSGVSLLLLIQFDIGLRSLFYGELVSGIFYMIISFFFLKDHLKFGFTFSVFQDIFRIGLPAVPKNLFGQIQANINKYFISIYMGVGDLGLFQKSEFIFKGLKGLQRSFSSSAAPKNIELSAKSKEDLETGKYTVVFMYFLSLVLIISIFFMRDVFILLNVNEAFLDAAKFAPLFGFSVLFSGFSMMFSNNILVSGKTYFFTIRSIITGIAAILLNIILIPLYGVSGAIYATILCAILSLSIEIFISEIILSCKTKINYWIWISIIVYQIAMFILNESLHIDLFYLKPLFILFYFTLILLVDFLLVKAINWKEVRIRFSQIIDQSNVR